VRLSLSPRDHRLYLTARNSNALLVFDTDQVLTNAAHVVPVKIPVGTSPVPVVNVLDGKLVLVGNSDRFNPQTASSTLTVVDTSRIGTAQNPIIGSIPSGAFPRNFQLTPDGKTLYLSNFLSGTIQVLDVARLASYLSP
jgi:DNA-binding beta-propeller fold protein YncE